MRSQSKTADAKQASSALLCSNLSLKCVSGVVLSKAALPRSSQARLRILAAWYSMKGLKGWY